MKMKIINWHYIKNQEIPFKGTTLITGDNGMGKSTILDAMFFVLSGGKSTFNTAANKKSKRDLLGYVRGKTNIDNDPYLRRGSVTCHLALEFYDQEKRKSFTVGAIIDSTTEFAELKKHFYTYETKIADGMFTNRDGIVRNIQSSKIVLKNLSQYKGLMPSEAKQAFMTRFGRIDDKLVELLQQSLAFKPINEINTFIEHHLLEPDNIKVEELRESIRSIEELKNKITSLEKEKISLDEIVDNHEEYLKFVDKKNENDLLIDLHAIKKNDFAIEEKSSENRELRVKIDGYETKRKNLKTRLDNERNIKDEYLKALNSEEGIKFAEINKQLNHSKEEKTILEEKKADYQLTVNAILSDYKMLEKKFVAEMNESDFTSRENFENLITSLNMIKDRLSEYKFELNKIKNDLKAEKSDKEKNQKRLLNKQITYPSYITKLKEEIDKSLKEEYGVTDKVHIFSSLLSVNDSEWRDALEGYLNTQRFNLIVEPAYYQDTIKIYESIKDKLNIYSVGIVDVKKIPNKYDEVIDNSLASIVDSNNIYARRYANLLLNNVMLAKDVKDLNNYKKSITKICMRYANFTTYAINKRNYEDQYIGSDAIRIQLNKVRRELKSINTKLLKNETEFINLIANIDLINQIKDEKNTIVEGINIDGRIDETKSEIKRLESQISKFDPAAFEIEFRIDDCNKKIKGLEENLNKNLVSKTEDSKTITNNTVDIKRMNSLKMELNSTFDLHLSESALSEKEIEDSYNKFIKKDDVDNRLNKIQNKYSKKIVEVEDHIKTLQLNYCNDFRVSLKFGTEFMSSYIERKKEISSFELFNMNDELDKAKETSENYFKNQFLAQLNEKIKTAIDKVKELNKALKDIVFGEDSYEFKYSKSKKYSNYYDLIMNESNESTGYNLFKDEFHSTNSIVMDELYNQLLTLEEGGEAYNDFVDYRKYLEFDITIRNVRTNEKKYFSEASKTQSGGELQAPFYVAIAASFKRLYSVTDSTIRVVLFDEAFDKMDSNRIESILSFLSELKLQYIIAAPPQKIDTIDEFVNTTLIVVREDRNIDVVERGTINETV